VISGMRWDHIDHFVTGNRAVSVYWKIVEQKDRL
jgi:hypothetical protein